MRIACAGRWTADPGDAARAKVIAAAEQWRAGGHDVRLFGLPPVRYAHRTAPRRGRLGAGGVGDSIVATVRLRRAIRAYAPDVVYIRYGLFIPSLAPIQRRFASVVEINADDRAEAALHGHWARRVLNELSRRSLLGGAAGIVAVSHELARDVAPFGKPARVIANGARLDVEMSPALPRDARPLAAFLVGVPMPWHGLDKLLCLAHAIPEWDFAIVGADDPAVLPAAAPPNLRLRPVMGRDGYGPILARADVGIGSLAMHRAGLSEGSPLKVREYLAHGLPVVLAFEDTDFAGDPPWFVLRLPNHEDNVRDGIDDLRRFMALVRGRRVGREEVAERVGATAKERERLAFMADVVAARAR